MKLRVRNCPLVAAALSVALGAASVDAALVTDFFSLKAPATTLSGTGNTDDPVLGTAVLSADGARMMGYFPAQTLTNVGDSLTLSFSLQFTAGTIVSSSDNFRFALYDQNSEATIPTNSDLAVVGNDDTDAFRGYWYGVDTNSGGTGVQGTIRERPGTNLTIDDPFTNTGTTQISSPGGTAVPFASGQTYTGLMTLTLTGASEITLTGAFSGNGGANTFLFVDTTAIATTYGVVGFLNGGGINADQVTFTNVDVTFTPIPEPATWLLGLGSLVGAVFVRRRAG